MRVPRGDEDPGAFRPCVSFSVLQHCFGRLRSGLGCGFGVARLALNFAQQGESHHDRHICHECEKHIGRPADAVLHWPWSGRRSGSGDGDVRGVGAGHGPPSQSVDESGLAALDMGGADGAVEVAGPETEGAAAGAADDGGPWREGTACPAHAKGNERPGKQHCSDCPDCTLHCATVAQGKAQISKRLHGR